MRGTLGAGAAMALVLAGIGAGAPAGAKGEKSAAQARCPFTLRAAPVAERGGAGQGSGDGYAPLSCLPEVVPTTDYGGALAGAVEAVSGRPAVFLPGGDVLAAVPAAQSAAYGAQYPATASALEKVTPAGKVLWQVPLTDADSTLAAGTAVAALLGNGLDVVNLSTRKLAHVKLSGPFVGYQMGVVGSTVVLLRYAGDMGTGTASGMLFFFNANGHAIGKMAVGGSDDVNAPFYANGHLADFVIGNQFYQVTGPMRVRGPVPIPGQWTSLTALPDGSVLVTNQENLMARFTIGKAGLRQVWSATVAGMGQVVAGAGAIVVGGSEQIGPLGLTVRSVQTGAVVGHLSVAHAALQPLAAGPFGVVALESPCAGAGVPCASATAQGTQRLLLLDAAGTESWAQPECSSLGKGMQAWLYDLSGHWRMLTACDPGFQVQWGGPVATGTPDTAGYLPSGGPPALWPLPQGAAAGYAVFDRTTRITQAHPLVVSAAQAGVSIPLTVSPVDASGAPVPAVGLAPITLGDGGSGGDFVDTGSGRTAATQIAYVERGATADAITYANPSAGSYALTAQAVADGAQDLDTAYQQPAAPVAIIAGSRFTLVLDLVDENGVPITVPEGDTVKLGLQSGSDASGALTKVATRSGPDVYTASFTAGRKRSGTVLPVVAVYAAAGGWVMGGGAADPTPVARVAPPSVTAAVAAAGVAVDVGPPPSGDPPVGYLLFRVAAASDVPSGQSGALSGAVALLPSLGGGPLAYVNRGGTAGEVYYAESLDGVGVASVASPPAVAP